jgi:hypothetical protein
VDRVLSVYEFAVEVAARKIHQDDETFLKESNTPFVTTLEVFPWSELVPWFRNDMQTRVSERAGPGLTLQL